ncbi:MAG: 5-formyltetrahydrofolate cyclo-ligase [Bradyrhizobiaceae bacterium]|nr:5-formyltetrahydrofolate cyclo-ligase [Bradyrhizobiaceae bacterium]
MNIADIAARKTELRTEALARRDALAPEARAAAAEAIAARPLPVAPRAGTIVSGFMPIKSEINPLPLLRRYAEAGAQLALPKIVGRGQALSMRAWSIGAPLVKGQWNICEPDAAAPEVEPDIMIVPLAAFDRQGHRIGYGAGYYDRTIQSLRAKKPVTAIGIAFAMQEFDEVPALSHDARLDLVLTEREAIDCRGA